MSRIAEQLKATFPPDSYYEARLEGIWGKHTGNGWYLWSGLCPFHADSKPGSFFINKETGAFKCFSCGASGGDVIAFHMMITGLSFREATTQLQGLLR